MNSKILDNMLAEMLQYKNISLNDNIELRLDKITLLYIKELDLKYSALLSKKNSVSMIKEISRL